MGQPQLLWTTWARASHATIQPIPYPPSGPSIKSVSLQFNDKDVMGSSDKCFAEVQVDDVSCSSLTHQHCNPVAEGHQICHALRGAAQGRGGQWGQLRNRGDAPAWTFSWGCLFAVVPFLHFLSRKTPSGHTLCCGARGTFAPAQSSIYTSKDLARVYFLSCVTDFIFNLLQFAGAFFKEMNSWYFL